MILFFFLLLSSGEEIWWSNNSYRRVKLFIHCTVYDEGEQQSETCQLRYPTSLSCSLCPHNMGNYPHIDGFKRLTSRIQYRLQKTPVYPFYYRGEGFRRPQMTENSVIINTAAQAENRGSNQVTTFLVESNSINT